MFVCLIRTQDDVFVCETAEQINAVVSVLKEENTAFTAEFVPPNA